MVTEYLLWNRRLAERFFRPEMAGRRVNLYVTEDMINELAPPEWGGLPGFIDALRGGPSWVRSGGICQRAFRTFADWRQRGLEYPPYVAYLAFFVLAAGLEGDFAPHAYYPRLRTLLGEPPYAGMYSGFDRMIELWFDLEHWSNEDTQGALGIFSVTFAVNWPHVGIPTAQTLLTEHERRCLPTLFFQSGLDPTSPPSPQELSNTLLVYGRHNLGHRTLHLLEQPAHGEHDRRRALLSVVLDELLAWDGTCPATSTSVGAQLGVFAALRLCGERLDPVAGRARFTLRCRTNHEFPEEGLTLSGTSEEPFGFCEEFGRGWSLPLVGVDGRRIDASSLCWTLGLQLRDQDRKWRLVLPPSPVRIFVSGEAESIGGLVETHQLPRDRPFHLAVEHSWVPLVDRWGRSDCVGFRPIPLAAGLPPDWYLFRADRACSDDAVRQHLPVLSFPKEVRLSLEGGVKSAEGYQYFRFALPAVRLQGGSSSTQVFCNGVQLERDQATFQLPEALETSKVALEAREGGGIVARQVLYVVDHLSWPPAVANVRFDEFGNLATETTPEGWVFSGAVVGNAGAAAVDAEYCLPPHREAIAYLVGRMPGEIILWPKEPLPDSWEPVWLVPVRPRGEVLFCGRSISHAAPDQDRTTGSRDRLYLWKEILWKRRHWVLLPFHRSLKGLWEDYERVASRAL